MSLRDEALRIHHMLTELTFNLSMFRMDSAALDEIEKRAAHGDKFLVEASFEMQMKLKSVTEPEDYTAIGQAYETYEEAMIYMLLRDRNLSVKRTQGTGGHAQKRPDFQCDHARGTFFIEVKTLDFQDGALRHKEIAYEALDAKADLDGRARTPGVHFGKEVDIASHRPGATPTERIETAIRKIKSNIKLGQINYGPTVLVIDLTRLSLDAGDASALLPVYFDNAGHTYACVSGELWYVAFGQPGDQILVRTEFDGQSNLGDRLQETGVYVDYPELMAIAFVSRSLQSVTRIFALQKFMPDFSRLQNPTKLSENDISEILLEFCDEFNDDHNERALDLQIRK